MKKRLLGVLLALVALGAMAGSAFAATSWDITLSIDVAGTATTLAVDLDIKSTDVDHFVSEDVSESTAFSSKAIASTTSVTVSSDKKVQFKDASTASADLTGVWIVSGDAGTDVTSKYLDAAAVVSETTTFYLVVNVSADVVSKNVLGDSEKANLIVSVKVTVDDGSSDDGGSVTPTPDTTKTKPSIESVFSAVKVVSSRAATALSRYFSNLVSMVSILKEVSTAQMTVISTDILTQLSTGEHGFVVGVATLPSNAGAYSFAVDLSKTAASSDLAGKALEVWVYIFSSSTSSVELASVTEKAGTYEELTGAKIVNDSGTEITSLSSSNMSGVNIAADFSKYAGKTVAPFLIAASTGSTTPDTPSSSTSPKSGNSGCDMGMGSLALLLAAALPLLRKVR